MRCRLLTLAVLAGLMLPGIPSLAVSNADYLALRARTTVTSLPDPGRIATQLAGRGGQVIEVEGVVNGIIAGNESTSFLLRGGNQTLLFCMAQEDPAVVVGATVRLLARIPAQGAILEVVSVTQPAAELAKADAKARPAPSPLKPPPAATGWAPVYSSPARVVTSPSDTPVEAWKVDAYAAKIQEFNKRLNAEGAQKIAYHILEKSQRYGVDPRLTFALVCQESRFNPNAVSRSGAMGLGQLMPGTAAGLGVGKPFDIEANIDGAVRYLVAQLTNFQDTTLALAAYNAGPNAVRRHGGVPPYNETQNYVRVVYRHYCRLAGINPESREGAT
ncbi:MAG: lytic transglycosylase domain-containing protein [Armatimonadota bacterium]